MGCGPFPETFVSELVIGTPESTSVAPGGSVRVAGASEPAAATGSESAGLCNGGWPLAFKLHVATPKSNAIISGRKNMDSPIVNEHWRIVRAFGKIGESNDPVIF
jgi:hypothetical protein